MKTLILLLLFPVLTFAQTGTQHDRIDVRGQVKTDKFINRATIIITGATPDVSTGNVFKTNNGGVVTVTNFLNGADTQLITVNCGDANTTIQNNANIVNTSAADFVCGVNKTISYVYDAAQVKWIQSGTGAAGGGGGSPGAPANCIQKNNGSGAFGCSGESSDGTTFKVNEDSQSTGPNPYADVRAFGKFATASSATATTTSGSPTISLSAASNFKNGEYVTVYNAGAACGLATPAAPTLTPSVNGGGVFTVAAGAGASSFAYKVVAADKFGCFTPASVSISTSAGNALGVQTFTISTLTRANNVVTVTTTATHSYVVGELVHIKYFSTTDGTFEGFWIVNTVPTGTTFTFVQGMDTRFGATTSATGGTVLGFNANLISWTAVPSAWKYYIYGRTGGTFALLGQTLLNSYVDYGSPMNDNQTFPTYVPTTAPVSGANDHLTAKINSGGGTTSLVLASNAGVSISATAQSDDGPALIAAANSTSAVYIPSQGITINSYTLAPAAKYYKLGGSIQGNDTIESGTSAIWESVGVSSGGNAASWGNTAKISGSAYPQFVLGNTNNLNKISFICAASNGCLNTVDSQDATEISFDFVQFATGLGNTFDYIGMNQLFKGGGFAFRYSKCLFTTGSPGPNNNTNIGNSPIPSVQFLPRGDGVTTNNTSITSTWFTQRGSINVAAGPGGIGWFIAKDIETQDSSLPFFQFSKSQFGIGVRGGIDIENLVGADRATAYVGNYQATGYPDIWIKKAPAGTGGRAILTGLPFSGITATGAGNLGHNTGYLTLGGPLSISTDGAIQASSLGFPMAIPAAPGVVVSAGGGANIGVFPYVVQFLDSNGLYGAQSPSVTATTTPGNQTVTITRPTAPTGAVSWVPFANGGAIPCSPVPVATTTYIFNVSLCSGSNPAATGNAVSIGSTGVSTPALNLWNNGFITAITGDSAANRTVTFPAGSGTACISTSAATCAVAGVTINGDAALTSSPRTVPPVFFPGALTTTWTGASWTLDKAITVTRVQSAAKVVPAGCSTSAIVRVTDGSTPINLTINAATNDSGVITQNYAAGATLTVSIVTAAAGCTTSPGDLNLSITSRMQ